jgi:hypothetical protein
MYDLKRIIEQNREAEKQGVADGAPVGTDAYYAQKAKEAAHEAKLALATQTAKAGVYTPQPVVERVEGKASEGGTSGHSSAQGGLRGHSIGVDYPFSVAGGFEAGDFGALHSVWTVVNHVSGARYGTFRGEGACKRAHDEAHRLADAWREGGQDGLTTALGLDGRNS